MDAYHLGIELELADALGLDVVPQDYFIVRTQRGTRPSDKRNDVGPIEHFHQRDATLKHPAEGVLEGMGLENFKPSV